MKATPATGLTRRLFTATSLAIILTATSSHAAINYTTLVPNPDPESETYAVPGNPFINPALSGSTTTSIWYNVRGNGSVSIEDGGTGISHPLGSFPGSGSFPVIAAQVGDSTATLSKISNGTGGGPYTAGGSIYYGGFSGAVNNPGGILSVSDASPVAGLQTIVFQIQMGGAWGYDFVDNGLPVLNYTTASGNVTNVAATYFENILPVYNGTITMPSGEESLYINTWALEWDLSGVEEPITSFDIQFEGVQHGQLYGLRLDQSGSVPEPSTALLGAFGLLTLLRRRKR